MAQIEFLLNGETVVLDDPAPTTTLLDWLRLERGLTGTKEGCNEGDCGACTVIVDGKAVNACILLLPQIHGKALTTVEGLDKHPVQDAMVKHHGSQCGFCTPGVVMSLVAAHGRGNTDHADILAGNLCRCTGYAPIIRAAKAVEWLGRDSLFASPRAPKTDGAVTLTGAYMPDDLDDFANWYADNPDAVIVSGATEVGLMLTKELRQLDKVVFINRIESLKTITDGPRGLRIGAGASLTALREAVATTKLDEPWLYSDFGELLRRFGSEQVRNSGTIGGNVANGSPIADTPPVLIALGALVTLRRGDRRREIPLEDFYIAYGKQDRQPGEFVESIFIPGQPDELGVYKISKRFDQDISALTAAFNIVVEGGEIISARVAFGGMAATPKRASMVEAALTGAPWSEDTIKAAQAAFAQDYAPISDQRGSAEYRLTLAQNLLMRYWLENTSGHRVRVVGGA